jgi:sensor domain CHASE-containing protein
MSFIVNHDGVVYEKDLGANTAASAAVMKQFNPDASWKKGS